MCLKQQIHTETIEGSWKHAKAHTNANGGTRDYMIQERLDEYIFHRTYLRDQPFNTWVMLKLLGKYGRQAAEFVATDKPPKKKLSEEERIEQRDRFYYRAEQIQEHSDDEEMESKQDGNSTEEEDQARTEVDQFGNLVEYNEYGEIVNVWYVDPQEHAEANERRRALEEEQILENPSAASNVRQEREIEQDDPQLYTQLTQYVNRNT